MPVPSLSYPYVQLPAGELGAPYKVSRDVPLRLSTPPLLPYPPDLPSSARDPESFSDLYTVTTHIFPAAFPRTHPDVPFPNMPTESADQQSHKNIISQAGKELFKARLDYEANLLNGLDHSAQNLWCCANLYSRKHVLSDSERGPGLTLIVAHAVGFNKEIWEPALSHLVALLERNSVSPIVDEIWCFDAVQHGDSGLLNAGRHSALWDWSDYGRDILNFMIHYLPESPYSSPPTHLARIPDSIALDRQSAGFSNRTVVGVGHSFGATVILLGAIKYPVLWSSIINIDPIVFARLEKKVVDKLTETLIVVSLRRPSSWSSREEASRALRSNRSFASWSAPAFENFVQYGLHDNPKTGQVHLKTNPTYEGAAYEGRTACEIWELLPTLDSRIELFWIMPQSNLTWPALSSAAKYLVWRRPKNSSNTIIPNCGHLMPMEQPEQLAGKMFDFLARKYGQRFSSSAGLSRL